MDHTLARQPLPKLIILHHYLHEHGYRRDIHSRYLALLNSLLGLLQLRQYGDHKKNIYRVYFCYVHLLLGSDILVWFVPGRVGRVETPSVSASPPWTGTFLVLCWVLRGQALTHMSAKSIATQM